MKLLIIALLSLILVGCEKEIQGDASKLPDTPAGRLDLVAQSFNSKEVVHVYSQVRESGADSFFYVVRIDDGTIWFIHVKKMAVYDKYLILHPFIKPAQ